MHKINPTKKDYYLKTKIYHEKYKLIFKYLYLYFSAFRKSDEEEELS